MATLRRPATRCPHKRQCTSKECRDCKDGLGNNECFVPKPKVPKKPKKPIEPLTPMQFHELDVPKKIHWLSMSYMNRCCAEGFTMKGLFQLRNYFGRIDTSKLQCFFDFISSLKEPAVVSIYDLHGRSEQHQLQLRLAANTPTTEVAQYPSLLSFINEL